MRYTIDTVGETAGAWGNTLRRAQEQGEIVIIEKGDPIEIVRTEMLRMKKAMEALEALGMGKELMIAYMRSKGVRQTDIDNVLHHQREFLKQIKLMK